MYIYIYIYNTVHVLVGYRFENKYKSYYTKISIKDYLSRYKNLSFH